MSWMLLTTSVEWSCVRNWLRWWWAIIIQGSGAYPYITYAMRGGEVSDLGNFACWCIWWGRWSV